MSSRKKPQSPRKTDIPEWAADVKPSDDVMAMFYAPTGQPKPGPLIPVAPPNAAPEPKEESGTVDEPGNASAPVSFPSPTDAEEIIRTNTQAAGKSEIRDNSPVVESQVAPEDSTSDHYGPDTLAHQANLGVTNQIESSEAESEPDTDPDLVSDEARLSEISPASTINKSAKALSPRGADFERHFGEWKPFLTQGQISVLEALFDMTYARDQAECFTSNAKVAQAAGISIRQTSAILKDLERFGFIARLETFNTRTRKGTIFRLYLTRQATPVSGKRVYHLEDE
jgi:hypothetical protein